VEVRLATRRDAAAVARVQQETWRAAYAHVFPADGLAGDFIDVDRWRRQLVDPPAGWTTFVAGDPVVGFASVGPSRDEPGTGELYAIYVHPDAWSTGAGRALLVRAEERLAEDYDEATLWVLEANPRARRFYERGGWRLEAGEAKDFERWGVSSREVRYRKRLRPAGAR
jgi:ribosomal protein S18 acetylase RimI-like enzyme